MSHASVLWALHGPTDWAVAILAAVWVLTALVVAVRRWLRPVEKRPGYLFDRDRDRIGL
jgi:membrane protein implicated in regulation of membrane protease activity